MKMPDFLKGRDGLGNVPPCLAVDDMPDGLRGNSIVPSEQGACCEAASTHKTNNFHCFVCESRHSIHLPARRYAEAVVARMDTVCGVRDILKIVGSIVELVPIPVVHLKVRRPRAKKCIGHKRVHPGGDLKSVPSDGHDEIAVSIRVRLPYQANPSTSGGARPADPPLVAHLIRPASNRLPVFHRATSCMACAAPNSPPEYTSNGGMWSR